MQCPFRKHYRRRLEDRVDVLTDLLQKRACKSVHRRKCRRGISPSGEEKPDLILMDVVMPGQNGFQLTRAITRDPFTRMCPSSCAPARTRKPTVWGMRPGRARLHHQAGRSRRAAGQNRRSELRRARRHGQPRRPHGSSDPFLPAACRLAKLRRYVRCPPGWRREPAARISMFAPGQSGKFSPGRSAAGACTQSWFLGWPTCVVACGGGRPGGLSVRTVLRTGQALSEASLLAFNAALDVNAPCWWTAGGLRGWTRLCRPNRAYRGFAQLLWHHLYRFQWHTLAGAELADPVPTS